MFDFFLINVKSNIKKYKLKIRHGFNIGILSKTINWTQ